MTRDASVLHLLVPGLLDRTGEWQASYGGVGRFPALEWLLARSTRRSVPYAGLGEVLAGLFAIAGPMPAGALTRLALTGERDAQVWMCMDPVHLEAGITDLVLTGPDQLHLGLDEARALVARINAHLAEDGLHIEVNAPGHWHLRLPATRAVPETRSLGEVLGRPINSRLPAGPEAAYWHRLINELQMVLFDAPENRAREARGLPSVNSVWPWGGGVLPSGLASPVSRLWGDDLLLAGLARCAQVPIEPLPETAEPVLAAGGARCVLLDSLHADAALDDLEAWQAGMEGLERAWFEPLRKALGTASLKRLVIHSTCGDVFEVPASARWRLWRRSEPLGRVVS
ncbi:hypothetical protein [Thioalkalivibrio sulfidiphilus]|uniref:hypothetical protein n=1 Tax=Thioalkalivibrio sulfidiphilus TaxID=1033854 RepID=UPI003B2F8840